MICVGLKLYGYCGGHFGRDSYEDKRIEAFGVDWIVARGSDSEGVHFTDFQDVDQRDEFVAEHSQTNHSLEETE